ncbi:MAG: glycosyltransferase family 87 protein [Candidatus Sumerlaeota bacterium]|nr:glycosyltransferase family 87 protein [Candidatus Sumerlaeota bacterium]
MHPFTHYSKKTLLVFLLVYLFCVVFYILLFLHDPHIDFVPLYIVGNLWRTGGPPWYYDYQILDQAYFAETAAKTWRPGYILTTPKYIDDYAVKLGFQSKYSTTLYLYFPTFIPVFSLFALLPYNMSANIMMALSILVIMLIIKIIISKTTSAEASAKAGAIAILIILFSNPARMAIGWGQFTPYLFALTFMSLYLEERSLTSHSFSDGAGKSIAAGLLLAVAAWCKFFPGLLILYWLFRRDFRSIAAFLAGCALIFAAGFVMFDRAVIHAYFELLKVMGRGVTFCAANQSIEAFFMRFQHPIQQMLGIVTYSAPGGLKIIALIIKALIIFSWFSLIMRLKSREKVGGAPNHNTIIAGYYLMAVMIMLLPISWTHYYLFLMPLTFYMLDLFRDKQLNIPVLMKVVFVIAVIFTFFPPGALSLKYVADFMNATIGKKVSVNVVKFLFSSHLVGGLVMLLLAQLTLRYHINKSRG